MIARHFGGFFGLDGSEGWAPSEVLEIHPENTAAVVDGAEAALAGAGVVADGHGVDIVAQARHFSNHFHLNGETVRFEVRPEAFYDFSLPGKVACEHIGNVDAV